MGNLKINKYLNNQIILFLNIALLTTLSPDKYLLFRLRGKIKNIYRYIDTNDKLYLNYWEYNTYEQ